MSGTRRSTNGAPGGFVSIAIAGVLFLAPMARAARADAPDATPPAQQASAEELAEQAYRLHAEGKYAEAIATYLKAYGISSAGATLFNIAVIYDRKLHERELATEYYRRYLATTDVDPDLVQKATERLTFLKRDGEAAELAPRSTRILPAVSPAPEAASSMTVATNAPSMAQVPSPATNPAGIETPPPGRRGAGMRTGGIIVGATGVAGVSASLVLGLLAKAKNDDANTVCNGPAFSSARGVSLGQQAGTFATASTAVFAAGLACLGGGIALYLAAPASSAPPRLSVAPEVARTGAGMNVQVRF